MGMPVFNGDEFLEEAIRSLIAQTYEDFELVISDNASNDRTREICLDYASQDSRIVYTRHDTNIGYCRNQNGIILKARGDYYLVTHSDDVRAPSYLSRTLEVLEADPTVVVCYSQTRDIDEDGRPKAREVPYLRFHSTDYRERFADVIRMDHICEPDFGTTRMADLRATRLHGNYADSDRVLLAELSFRGRFVCIPEYLFFRRAHQGQSTAIAPGRQERTVWYDPNNRGRLLLPHFRQLLEYLAAIQRAPIGVGAKAWCAARMCAWTATNRRRLLADLHYVLRQTLGPTYRRVRASLG
jgi:glycosyltransferase involved in cell wall biosynthesis